MTPALTKLLIGAGATAVVGSGGYGIYYFATTPKTIKQQLIKDGFKPLNLSDENADSTKWNAKLTEYKNTSSTFSKFDGLSLSDSEQDTEKIKKLKGECKKFLDTSLSSSDSAKLLPKVKAWCFSGTLGNNQD